MHVIIVGAGNFGRSLVKLLASEGHDVVVIDKDKESATSISEPFDCLVLNGDGANVEILEEAKIKKADAFVALTGDDEANLMLCQFAKRYKVGMIVSGVNQFGTVINANVIFEYNYLLGTRDTNHYWHIWPARNGTYAVAEGVGGDRWGAVLVR